MSTNTLKITRDGVEIVENNTNGFEDRLTALEANAHQEVSLAIVNGKIAAIESNVLTNQTRLNDLTAVENAVTALQAVSHTEVDLTAVNAAIAALQANAHIEVSLTAVNAALADLEASKLEATDLAAVEAAIAALQALNPDNVSVDTLATSAALAHKASLNDDVTFNSVSVKVGEEYDSRTQPKPSGPYKAVDVYQVAIDNMQVLSPVKYLVADVTAKLDLQLTNVQTVDVVEADGNTYTYYGRTNSDGEVEYLTYPAPRICTITVPSTRTDSDTLFDAYADEEYFSAKFNIDDILFLPDNEGMRPTLKADTGDANSFPRLLATLSTTAISGFHESVRSNAQTHVDTITGMLSQEAISVDDAVDFFLDQSINSNNAPGTRLEIYDLYKASTNRKLAKEIRVRRKKFAMATTKTNDVYGSTGDFTKILQPNGKKIPIVLTPTHGRAPGYTQMATELASWGMAVISPICHYTNNVYQRVPGKVRTVRQIISENTVNFTPDYVYNTYSGFNGSYDVAPVQEPMRNGNALDGRGNFAKMRDQFFRKDDNQTGHSGYDYLKSCFLNLCDVLDNAVDAAGVKLNTVLDTNNIGGFSYSGEIDCWGGNLLADPSNWAGSRFKCHIGNENGYMRWDLGQFGYKPEDDQLVTGTTGFKVPTMIFEQENEGYYRDNIRSGEDPLYLVGSRRNLQKMFRQSSRAARDSSIFVEVPMMEHGDSAINAYFPYDLKPAFLAGASDVDLTGDIFKHLPSTYSRTTDAADIIYGPRNFNETPILLEASVSLQVVATTFLRKWLLNDDTRLIPVLHKASVKFDQRPWNIPGADDYSWLADTSPGIYDRTWELDMGGKALMEVDNTSNNLTIKAEYGKTLDTLRVEANLRVEAKIESPLTPLDNEYMAIDLSEMKFIDANYQIPIMNGDIQSLSAVIKNGSYTDGNVFSATNNYNKAYTTSNTNTDFTFSYLNAGGAVWEEITENSNVWLRSGQPEPESGYNENEVSPPGNGSSMRIEFTIDPTITTGAGIVTFYGKCDSEPTYDFLQLLVNNEVVQQKSGQEEGEFSAVVSGGDEITIRYIKDVAWKAYTDVVFVKDIAVTGFASSSATPIPVTADANVSVVNLTYNGVEVLSANVDVLATSTSVAGVTGEMNGLSLKMTENVASGLLLLKFNRLIEPTTAYTPLKLSF